MGWRDVQAKVASGELDYRRPAKSGFDMFADGFAGSFSESMRAARAERSEQARYDRNRSDKLADEERLRAQELEKERKARLEQALADAKEQERVEKDRLAKAKKLLKENGRDHTNPNFIQYAVDHVKTYDDNFADASTAFVELNKRITEVGPMQGPLLRRDGISVDTALDSTRRALGNPKANPGDSEMFPDPAGIDAQMRTAIEDKTDKTLSKQGIETAGDFRDSANKQMSEILGTGKATGVRSALRAGESGGKTDAVDFNKEDGKDHVGLYQIGQGRLDDYNQANGTSYTVEQLKEMSEEEQEKIADWHFDDIDAYIDRNNLEKYIGQTIGGVTITRSGMIAMAHLGGNGGMKRYLESNGEYNPDDSGSGVKGNSLADYAKKFGDLDDTTTRGVGEASEGDMSPSFAIDAPDMEPEFKFADLTKDNYLGIAQDLRRKGKEELANQVESFGSSAFTDTKKNSKLTDSDYAAMYAKYSRMRSSTVKEDREAAEAWFKSEEPSLRQGLEAAKGLGDKPSQEILYIMTNGKRIAARQGEDGNYIPIDPNDGESVSKDAVTAVDTEESVALIESGLNSVSVQTKAQRNKMQAASEVTIQGYELAEMARENPVVLTLVGATQSALVGARQEAEALFNLLGEGSNAEMDQGTLLGKMNAYIDSRNFDNADEANAYKQFSAAMVRYVFAAGKALGQEGNGFSNQDYNNIRGAMFAGKGIEGFEQNLQTFARQRLADATSSAITLRESGQVQFGIENGASFGSDLWTAKEKFENTNPDGLLPDYFGWANSTTSSDSVLSFTDMEDKEFMTLMLDAKNEDGTYDYSKYSPKQQSEIRKRLLKMATSSQQGG
jgi:hypothetical protein